MSAFVINEWLWHDAMGDNGESNQRDALHVVDTLARWDHSIVIVNGSGFDRKAWACCKSYSQIVQRLGAAFFGAVRIDSDRCVLLEADQLADLPEDLAVAVNLDDHYLVRAMYAVQGSTLVTVDSALCGCVSGKGLPCLSREEFLTDYVTPKVT